MSFSLISTVGAVAVLNLLFYFYKAISNPLSSVPGPWYAKYTGLVLKYLFVSGQHAKYVEELHQQYGPVVRLSPTEVNFCTTTAAKVIHGYRQPFRKGEMYSRIITPGMENVFSTTDPTFHSRHRRLLSAPLSESSLREFEPVVAERVDLALQKMKEEMESSGAADVLKWWLFMATDIIGELSFGDSFRMLELGRKNQYAEDLGKLAFMTGLRISFPALVRLSAWVSLPVFKEAYAASERLKFYAQKSVQRYQKILEADPSNSPRTLFAKLYQAGEEGLSPQEIVAEAQAYIVAGSDTTALSLTYLVWAVCKDDAVRQRLVEEVARLPDGFSDEDLKTATYLNMVIRETLRLYAAAPSGLPRLVPASGCKIDGYWVPGGTTVCTQAYSMHRDPAIFPEPERFDPSRWENPTVEMQDMSMPFGGGSRVCLGLHLARMELRIATARFFKAFPNACPSTKDGFCDDDMDQKIYFLMFPKKKRCLMQMS